jgi:PAS domain S-box-containing protein
MAPSRGGLPPALAEAILEQAPDALVLVDGGGLVRFVNPAVTALLGYPAAALVGQPVETLIPDRFRSAHTRYRDLYAASPVAREMGARVVALSARTATGDEIPVEIRLAPVVAGGEHYTVAALRDVRDRRQIMDELREARLVAERADRAKTRFLATASHDLRQPLQTLQLLAGALVRQVQDTPAADLVTRQLRALDAMADLLNALLDVSRLESGGVQPILAEVALRDLCTDLGRHFEAAAAARGLALAVSCPEVTVRTDRVLLRQLLQNLVSNALKFTREGGVQVSVSDAAGAVVITVADSGIGIPPDELGRIFDEYYQVAGVHTEQRGFGLGLTIVRQLARLLGLGLGVESAPGQGTSFRLTLPAELRVATTATTAAPRAGVATPASTALKPAVLIVEDDAPVRSALELLLSLEGYPVRAVGTAGAAIATFREFGHDIDIVLTDYHLGDGETGLGVLRQLRELAGRDLPAVVLSGDTSSFVANLAATERVRVLRKPVDPAVLVATMEALFGEAA